MHTESEFGKLYFTVLRDMLAPCPIFFTVIQKRQPHDEVIAMYGGACYSDEDEEDYSKHGATTRSALIQHILRCMKTTNYFTSFEHKEFFTEEPFFYRKNRTYFNYSSSHGFFTDETVLITSDNMLSLIKREHFPHMDMAEFHALKDFFRKTSMKPLTLIPSRSPL